MRRTTIAYFGPVDFVERNGKQYAEVHEGYKTGEVDAEDGLRALGEADRIGREYGTERFIIPKFSEAQVVIMQKPTSPMGY